MHNAMLGAIILIVLHLFVAALSVYSYSEAKRFVQKVVVKCSFLAASILQLLTLSSTSRLKFKLIALLI